MKALWHSLKPLFLLWGVMKEEGFFTQIELLEPMRRGNSEPETKATCRECTLSLLECWTAGPSRGAKSKQNQRMECRATSRCFSEHELISSLWSSHWTGRKHLPRPSFTSRIIRSTRTNGKLEFTFRSICWFCFTWSIETSSSSFFQYIIWASLSPPPTNCTPDCDDRIVCRN